MIYVSTSGLKRTKIKDSVFEIAERGFKNIELSGGSDYYEGFVDDLLELKSKYSLNYRCHNYFPPPEEHFVLNLGSGHQPILEKTREHMDKTLKLSQMLGSGEYGIHAGYLIDPQVDELGREISEKKMTPYGEGLKRFGDELVRTMEKAEAFDVKIFVENNVISPKNFETFGGQNPLLLTHADEILNFQKEVSMNLLLDVAHLKVSCVTLEHDFAGQMGQLVPVADYLHISDNDGTADTNEGFHKNSELYSILHDLRDCLKNKTYTLEVYDGLDSITESYESLESLL